MGKILMAYASQTGNTEEVTDILEEQLEEMGHVVIVKCFDFEDVPFEQLEQYDALLVGTYTWDDGDLPYEVEDFYIDMEQVDMTNHIMGVYGSADPFYDTYGGAIEMIWDLAKDLGATLVGKPLKIDFEPDREDEERLYTFAKDMTEKIKQKNINAA